MKNGGSGTERVEGVRHLSLAQKILCVFVSITMVLTLNPAAGLVKIAYADEDTGGGDQTTTQVQQTAVEGVATVTEGDAAGQQAVEQPAAPAGEQAALAADDDSESAKLAEDAVAKIGDVEYKTLEAAVDAARRADTIEVLCDITESPDRWTIDYNYVTIDFGGYTLTTTSAYGFYQTGDASEFTLQNGTINTSGIAVYSCGNETYLNNMTITSTGDYAVFVYPDELSWATVDIDEDSHITSTAKDAIAMLTTYEQGEINIFGEVVSSAEGYSAIASNGSADFDVDVNIYGGATVKATSGPAIYAPAPGDIKISGGLVEGTDSAIGMKAGNLTVTGGKLHATGEYAIPTAGAGSGINASGAALQIESNKSYGNVKINISGGELVSDNAVAVYEYLGAGTASRVKSLAISGGKFKGAEGKDAILISDALAGTDVGKGFITGGIYSASPEEAFVAEGYEVTDNPDLLTSEAYPYMVRALTPVTISGIIAADKTYDGTTYATLDYSEVVIEGLAEGDDVAVIATGAFVDANVGEDKTVTISNLALLGDDAIHYVLAEEGQQDETTASITAKEVTVSGITAADKTYDGTTDATLDCSAAIFEGVLEGETLGVTATGTFADAKVGADKAVAISELALTGEAAANYALAEEGQQAETTAAITAKEVTVSGITAADKTYDGTTVATLGYDAVEIEGLVEGDDVTVTATGTFADAKVGADKAVAISELALTGDDAANYVLAEEGQQAETTAAITVAAVTVSGITAADKTYDGTTVATLGYDSVEIEGLVEGDKLTVTATGAFADKNVGEGKAVAISELALAGDDAANYALAEEGQQAETTASITAKEVTVSGITAADKTYDGTTDAVLNCKQETVVIEGLVEGDDVTATATGAFADKNVGEGKAVAISELALAGDDAANYALAEEGQQAETTAAITAKDVKVSGITAADKTYDGTTVATLGYDAAEIEGLAEGDDVAVTATGAFADAKVGADKAVAISELALAGDDAANYVLAAEGQQAETTAAITVAAVTVSGITAADKTYDGTTVAALDCSAAIFEGIVEGDKLTVTATGAFADKNVGEGKAVAISELALAGDDAANYALAEEGQQAETTAAITAKDVKVSGITAADKTYDGTTVAVLNCKQETVVIEGLVEGDDVTVTATGAFADKNVGEGKAVAISELALAGADAANYVLAAEGQQDEATASIAAKEVKVSGITAAGKIYDGSTVAVLNCKQETVVIDGLVEGETLDVTATGTFNNKNAGANKKVTISNLALTGDAAGNYVLAAKGQQTSTKATITAKPVIVGGITAKNKTYDGTTAATLTCTKAIFNGIVKGDKLTVTAKGEFADANAGKGKAVAISGLKLSGTSAANYELAPEGQQTSATATINQKSIAKATLPSIADQVYTGKAFKPAITVKLDGVTLKSGTDYTVAYKNNTKPGTATVTATGKGNYTGSAKTTFKIVKADWKDVSKANNAVATFVESSKAGFANGAKAAVLVRSDNFPDSLGASALAGALEAPVIATTPSALSADAKTEIIRLKCSTVYIVGGTTAVSTSVEKSVKALGCKVVRLDGATRTETANLVAAKVTALTGNKTTAIIAKGWDFPDTLSIGSYAYAAKTPILLADTDGMLDSATLKMAKGFKNIVVVGGTAGQGIKDSAANKIGKPWYRIAGDTRYETSASIAQWAAGKTTGAKVQPTVKLGYEHMAVASGTEFIGGLAAVNVAGPSKSVLVLVNPSDSPANQIALTKVVKPNITKMILGYILEGPSGVGSTIDSYLKKLL